MTDEKNSLASDPTNGNQSSVSPAAGDPESERVHDNHLCPDCLQALAERNEYKAGWQRARADYLNLQKDIERDKAEWVSWSKGHILQEVIPIYDNFKKAFAHCPDESNTTQWKNWADGVGFIMKQFSEFLKNHEVEEIKSVGAVFDPAVHEIVAEEASLEHAEHTVIREVEGGYTIKGKVLRVAKVVVAGSPEAGAATA